MVPLRHVLRHSGRTVWNFSRVILLMLFTSTLRMSLAPTRLLTSAKLQGSM